MADSANSVAVPGQTPKSEELPTTTAAEEAGFRTVIRRPKKRPTVLGDSDPVQDAKTPRNRESRDSPQHQLRRSGSMSSVSSAASITSAASMASRPATPPPRPPRIPPIVLANPGNWTRTAALLKKAITGVLDVKCQGSQFKIFPASVDDFRAIQKVLCEQKLAYHTFTLPEDRELKVVLRGVPYETSSDEIVAELESLGYQPTYVTPLLTRDHVKVNVFLVKLKRVGNFADIYNLRSLF